jgi:hypothetical protein
VRKGGGLKCLNLGYDDIVRIGDIEHGQLAEMPHIADEAVNVDVA